MRSRLFSWFGDEFQQAVKSGKLAGILGQLFNVLLPFKSRSKSSWSEIGLAKKMCQSHAA